MSNDGLTLTDGEFDVVMTEIDQKLRSDSERIVGRELRGWFAYCQRFSMTMPIDSSIATRVFDWFKNLYGDRLNMDWDFGQTAVSIQEDLYRLRCVHFYGTMYAVCSPALFGKRGAHRNPHGVTESVVNVLNHIETLTPELSSRLSPEACAEILRAYGRSFLAFSRMMAVPETIYVKEIVDDLTTSGSMLLQRNPNYGLSNWASLQAAEKTLKSFISIQGQEHKNTHDLTSLLSHASSLGLAPVDAALVAQIQCGPKVRYDSKLINKAQALAAHYAALTLCGELALVLVLPVPVVVQGFRKLPSRSHTRPAQIRIAKEWVINGLALMFQPPQFEK